MTHCCQWCGDELEGIHRSSGTCDACWYGMRLDADRWKQRLAELGRAPIEHSDEHGDWIAPHKGGAT